MRPEITEQDRRDLDDLYSSVDEAMHAGEWSELNLWLEIVARSVQECSIVWLIGVLTVSTWGDAKQHLPARKAVYEAVAELLEGDPEKDALLAGLEP